MGRYAGWIALNTGVSASADVILLPEIPYHIDKIAEVIARLVDRARGRSEDSTDQWADDEVSTL